MRSMRSVTSFAPWEMGAQSDEAGWALDRRRRRTGGDAGRNWFGMGRRGRQEVLEAYVRRALASCLAVDAVVVLTGTERECDLEAIKAKGDAGSHLGVDARDLAVKRVTDGVYERGLARSGRAGDGEEIQLLEIDDRPVAKGGEAFELEAEGTHSVASFQSHVRHRRARLWPRREAHGRASR